MRRSIPEPHLTDRQTLWRAGAGVLALTCLVGAIEGLAARDSISLVIASSAFPAVGAVVAAVFGPRLRPMTSFRVGQVFLALGTLSIALSVYTWRGTTAGGAMSLHYVMVVLFTAVFFDRRDVYIELVAIGTLLAAVLLLDGPSMIALLVWVTTMLPIVATGFVLNRLVEHLRAQSYRDALTGAVNRRAWDVAVREAVIDHQRRRRPLTVLLIDLDHFKQVNDTTGHEAGDEVLRRAVAAWRPLVRASDVVARFGGAEFGVLLPGCALEPAAHIASLLLAAVHDHAGLTCSIGVATAVEPSDAATLLDAADLQLYTAKSAGRACVRTTVVGSLAVVPHPAATGDAG